MVPWFITRDSFEYFIVKHLLYRDLKMYNNNSGYHTKKNVIMLYVILVELE
jgi:hypothetical protein